MRDEEKREYLILFQSKRIQAPDARDHKAWDVLQYARDDWRKGTEKNEISNHRKLTISRLNQNRFFLNFLIFLWRISSSWSSSRSCKILQISLVFLLCFCRRATQRHLPSLLPALRPWRWLRGYGRVWGREHARGSKPFPGIFQRFPVIMFSSYLAGWLSLFKT
jgi:hypothetical protein